MDVPSGFQGLATGGRCRKTGGREEGRGWVVILWASSCWAADLSWLHSPTKDHSSCCAPMAAISFVFLGLRMGKAFPVASPQVLPLPLLVLILPRSSQVVPSFNSL